MTIEDFQRPAKLARVIVLAGSLAIAACASQPTRVQEMDQTSGEDASYHLMLAEIAVERSQYADAAIEYYRAAAVSSDPELARRASEFADEYGFDAIALRAGQRWLEVAPESLGAQEFVGRYNLRRGDVDAAFKNFSALLGPLEQRIDSDYLTLSSDLGSENNQRGVGELLGRFALEDPDSAGVHAALAGALLRISFFDDAIEAADKARELGADWPQVDIIAARALVASGDVEAGLARIGELAISMPGLPLELEIVRLMAAGGMDDRAREHLEVVSMRFPGESDVTQLKGLLALQAGDLDAAKVAFNEQLASGQRIYDAHYFLGRVAISRREFLQSVSHFERVGGGNYLVPARIESSRVHVILGDPETGLDVLRRFEEDYPREAVHVIEPQAQILASMERFEDALGEYDRALIYRPDNVDLYLGRGALYERMSNVDAAVDDFQRAARIEPDSATVLNALGYTLANRTRKYREARRLIERALELDPDNPAIIDSMGWVLFRQGRLRQSRKYLERAWELLPDPEVAAHLGEVLWEMGDREAAEALWNEALDQSPESEPLTETMKRLME